VGGVFQNKQEGSFEPLSAPIRSLGTERYDEGERKKQQQQQQYNTMEGQKPSRRKDSTTFSIVRHIIRQSVKYKVLALVTGLAYWLLYAYSSGIFQYYSVDITPYLNADGLPNPQFLAPGSLAGLYNSGVIWYPTGHLELILFLGPTFFSFLLSILFSSSMILLIYSLRFRRFSKRTSQGSFFGLFGMLPAIFSGGCCAVPVATLLFGSIVPSSILFNFEFDDPLLLNLVIVILMLTSILYTAKKIGRENPNTCQACKG
jgi:hypothetical protein